MPRRLLSIDEINADRIDPAKHSYTDPALNLDAWALTTPGRAFETLPDRCVRYSFSDATVGRDMHTIQPDAWDVRNFEANPVFLWAHCDDELPIGRVEDLTTQAGRLVGLVRYAEHAFADTVYQLVKGSFLNATSTGWLPLEYRAANDRKRPGGLDFTRVELLEISQVPVPALPTALVTARKAGVDTRPLFDWAERLLDHGDFAVIPRPDLEALRKAARMPKNRAADKWSCTAARDLPIDNKTAWDGPEAEKRMLDAATHDGKIDVAEAGRGFLLHDGSGERGGFKEPFADLVDGKLTAIAGGIRAAAQRLPDVKDVPEAARKEAQAVIDAYHAKLAKEAEEPARDFHALARALKKRDLYLLADLCYVLAGLENVYDRAAAEALREGDDSDFPVKLRAWIDDGNRLLLENAGEETAEQIAGTQDDAGAPFYWSAAGLEAVVARALDARGLTRKGAKHSAETLRCLRDVHGHVRKANEQLSTLLDGADDNPETDANNPGDPDSADDSARAARQASERRAKADALKARLKA